MSFVLFDLIFLLVFCLFVGIFLYVNRKNIKKEGLMILYKTKLGLEAIEYIGKKYKKFLNKSEIFVSIIGYLLMIASVFLIIQMVWIFLKRPELVSAVKIPPIAPLIPYLPQLFKADYLPPFYFTYWILVLGVTAVVHEFFHGFYAKARNIRILSTGLAFLGPFFGAFVEPDENQVKKLKEREQIGFLAAGSFSNLLTAGVFFILFIIYFFIAYTPSGATFDSYAFSVVNTSFIEVGNHTFKADGLNLVSVKILNSTYYLEQANLAKLANQSQMIAYDDAPAVRAGVIGAIVQADGKKIRSQKQLSNFLESKKAGDEINLVTEFNGSKNNYKITLEARIDNGGAYLGVVSFKTQTKGFVGMIRERLSFFKQENTYYKTRFDGDLVIFIYNLIWWMILINLSVALFNMLPLGITDGGKVFYFTMIELTKSEKFAKISYKAITYLIIAIFIAITLYWIFRF